MAKQLTSRGIEKLRASNVRQEIPDSTTGLFLIVQPSGHKAFALRSRRPDGRSFKLTLGEFTPVETDGKPTLGAPLTLSGARQLAIELLRDRARGIDVAGRRRAEKVALRTTNGNSFGHAVEEFIRQHAMRETRRWDETARVLGLRPAGDQLEVIRGGLVDRWRDRAVDIIDGDDLFALIEETREHGTPGILPRNLGPSEGRARAMHAALSAFFTWLLKKRRIKTNPCASLVRPDAPKARARVLASKEIVSFWRATDSERTPVGAALKILLLTGARLREVNEMRREELSDDCATWTIPGSRTKNGREHVVPLPPLARDVLASIPGKGSYIFSANGRQPVALGSAAKSNIDRAMGVSDWVFHDLRRTFVTGLAELGVRPDVIELAVNHVSGHRGGIAGVYNKSELLPERRAALERWSSHIEGLLSGKAAKVLPLLRAEA